MKIKIFKPHASIKGTIARAFAIPGFFLTAMFVVVVVFGSLYAQYLEQIYLILLIVLGIVFMIFFILSAIFTAQILYRVFHDDLYAVTKDNMKALTDNNENLRSYQNKISIDEFDELNEEVDNLSTRFSNGYLLATVPDYSKTKLEYISRGIPLVTFASFKKEMYNIVFLSQSYKNVLIDADFNNKSTSITVEQETYLLKCFERAFKDYTGRLYIYNKNSKSFMIYLPVVDSFSRIKEQLYFILRECSTSVKESRGTMYIPLKFNVVSYPFSEVDEMLNDLSYAKRQGKLINFYLPNRLRTNFENRKLLLTNSMNINIMNRITSPLKDLTYSYEHEDKQINDIQNAFNSISSFLDLDESGIVLFDDIEQKYHYYVRSNTDNPLDFITESRNIVEILDENVDVDDSYFFSKRSHANNAIARYLDIIGVSSGYFYLLKYEGKFLGFVYFVKKKDDFIIDTYIQESLLMNCVRLEHYFIEMKYINDLDAYKAETEHIISISDYSVYKVDDYYHLTYFSKDLKRRYPHLENGKACFNAFYGLDKACANCPLKANKKKIVTYKNNDYQISLSLNDRKSHIKTMLMEKISGDDENKRDLYDQDLLINSFISLRKNLAISYEISGRGYLLLLSLDSLDEIMKSVGSEGTLYVLRRFIRELKNIIGSDEVYYYNSNTLAVMCHGKGHVDILNLCEKIYDASKQNYLDNSENSSNSSLNITYLPLGWPRGYATSDDFLRHVSDYYNLSTHPRNKDFIYFSDHNISRSASKRIFMLQVIEQEFSSEANFSSVSLQPIVRAKDKHIFGAEILLRINNVYSNAIFNAEEISRIAEQEGKTSLITESIVNFIGNMYKEYGQSVFKINDFARFCINIDSTYLKDPTLVKGIIKLNDIYKFPNGFLSFEIPEDIIPDNVTTIQKMARELAGARIHFSVDRYTGKYMGVDALKELGFNEIKLTRELIGRIDTDGVRYNEVRDIISKAKEAKINIAVVGVENSQQFTILREFDENMLMQGYHFYKPLSKSDFIAAVIAHDKYFE